ncbi:tRNA lysidine(34) synthetase TilS [Hyphobacterium sp.]|uniref:tRNA lysidine(34) synthetase TilS n=1 Tax=Hyphobacterium sp. TaxID=2004662 RepID=UPI003BAA63A0
MPLKPRPIERVSFNDGLAGWAGQTVLIGVSGGGDSLALLHFATDWARETGSDLRPVIIDHGLRMESTDEAAFAAGRAQALGWTPVIERWRASKSDTGLQAAARQFRLETFARLAGEAGAQAVLLGHTLDDQAETVWRRLLAGAGAEGLTAMSPIDPMPLWPAGRGIFLVRPLLNVRRRALRQWLTEAGERWIDDPSNINPAYSRVRDRAVLSKLESQGFDPARLAAMATQLQGRQRRDAAAAGRWLMQHARFHGWGGVMLPGGAAIPVTAMDALRAAVSGDPAPDARAARKLSAALKAGDAVTAGGAALSHRKGKAVLFRDPGHVTGRADKTRNRANSVRMSGITIWDGRFEVSDAALDILPFAAASAEGAEVPSMDAIPPAARASLPAIVKQGEFQGVAGFCPEISGVRWLADELVARNLFGDRPPAWFHTQLRDQSAQGSH